MAHHAVDDEGRARRLRRAELRSGLRLIPLLAEVLAHTQVQRSMGLLGAATVPWDTLRKELGLNGWVEPHEVERALITRLSEIRPGPVRLT